MARSPDSRKPAGPQQVGDLVSSFLRRRGLEGRVEAAGAIAEWDERVGPQIAEVTRPLRVSEGKLFVAVATSAWMNELNLMRAHLLRNLNAGRREGRIEGIVFVMDGADGAGPEAGPNGR